MVNCNTRLRQLARDAGPLLRLVACCAFLLLISGCGDARPQRVPVAGVVLIDGRPLTTGAIRFVPSEGRPAMGAIDQNGRFSLTCFTLNDGATLGVHEISVTATEKLPGDRVRWHAPKKYANHNTSGLTQEIARPVDDLVIELSWEGGQPFVES